MADNSAAIANIEAILNAGVTETVIDGTTVKYDFPSLRSRLAELRRTDDSATANARKPRIARINTSGLMGSSSTTSETTSE